MLIKSLGINFCMVTKTGADVIANSRETSNFHSYAINLYNTSELLACLTSFSRGLKGGYKK